MNAQIVKCIHCLVSLDPPTYDHVLPKSWYPKNTPPNLEKWSAPSCFDCNNRLGKIEQELLISMGLCVDPDASKSAGIADKALKPIKPELAQDEREKVFRSNNRIRILKKIIFVERDNPSLLPGFGPHPEQAGEVKLPAVLVKASDYKAVCEKIIRGLYYKLYGLYAENGYKVTVLINHEKDAKDFNGLLDAWGKKHHRSDGFTATTASTTDDPKAVLFKVEIWGKVTFYGVIQKDLVN